jgi:predicted MFS family arabinose efflux permease
MNSTSQIERATEIFDRADIRRGWWAVISRFLVHGLIVSTWVSRIPAIKDSLHLSNGDLGLALLGAAVGSLTAIPVCGMLVTRCGSSRITTWSGIGFCLSLVLPALAVNGLTLFLALVVYGMMAGANDVSMNAQGVGVEHLLGAPTMSRFHAMFSIGGIAGAALGGAVAARHVLALTHLSAGALVFLAITLATTPLMLDLYDPEAVQKSHKLPLRAIPPVLLAICAIGFCILVSEGAMADWIAVYLKQVLRAGPGTAATGYAVFSLGMAIFRLLGDLITVRLGHGRAVRVFALIAAGGLAFALLMESPYWALPGFAITGAGLSVIIPLVFASGSRIPGVSPGAGIATVTGLGYLGFLFGPPAIGFLSQLSTLRYALWLIVALELLSAGLAGAVGRLYRSSEA